VLARGSSGSHRSGSLPAPRWRNALPSEGRGHKFESCRARQRINGLAGLAADRAAPSYPVATKFEKKASSDRFSPPGSEEQQPSKLKVAGSNPAGVAIDYNALIEFLSIAKPVPLLSGNVWGNTGSKTPTTAHSRRHRRGRAHVSNLAGADHRKPPWGLERGRP
jgi:hypothetical protein